MPQGYFCACQPSFMMMRRLPNAIQHGHICYKIWFCRCHFARIFTCKSVGQFQHELHADKKFLLRCFQNRWFSPCRYGGGNERSAARMKTVPSEDDVERCVSENFQKVFPLCLDFYIEGQRAIWTRWQEVVLAEFTWMIDDYWYSCGAIWNNYSKEVSKKLVFEH